jgi:DNA-binding MarR family transcriptional regulator
MSEVQSLYPKVKELYHNVSRNPLTTDRDGQRPPNVGALLRMTYQLIRDRQIAVLSEKGYRDLNQPLMNVFLHPGPDRARPSELAARINMTKQAMNHLLGQLEKLGYIERRAEQKNGRRLVFLTKRGWQVRATILNAVSEVEAEWASILGQKRFGEFMNTLRQLSSVHHASRPLSCQRRRPRKTRADQDQSDA